MLYLTSTPLYHKQNKGPPIMAMIAALNSIQVTLNIFLVCFSVYFRLLFLYSYFTSLVPIHTSAIIFFCRYACIKKPAAPKREPRVFLQSVYASTSTTSLNLNSTISFSSQIAKSMSSVRHLSMHQSPQWQFINVSTTSLIDCQNHSPFYSLR